MKRTLFFIASLLASITMQAQDGANSYIPFVDAGKTWQVVCSTPGHNEIDEVTYYIPLGTEMVNGKTYYKMMAFINNTTESGAYLIREEDCKVYIFDTDLQKEYLMFDYSLKAGDTFETYSVEYKNTVKYEVYSVDDYTEGPVVSSFYYDEKADSMAVRHRYLRKWVVQSDIEKELCLEPKTWIEGIGSLEGPLANLYDTSYSLDHLAYVLFDGNYLPFSYRDSTDKLWFGCDLPTGAGYYKSVDKRHQLFYELEGNRLHVYGKVLTHGGANNYAYFIEEPTDDSSVRKLNFKIQEIGPLPDPMPGSDGLTLRTTDFYVEGFSPSFDYIIVDNQGEEHPVINKTTQMAYRPFVEEGKVWKVGVSSNNPVQQVDYFYFDGDTIINGKACKQMMCQRYVTPDYADYEIIMQHPLLMRSFVWYEEDKKVYTYDNTNKRFMLAYDFSLNAYDTLQIANNYNRDYILGPRQTGGIKGFKGVYRDVLNSCEGEYFHNITWLEGVGSIEGPTWIVYLGKEYHGGAFLMSCTVGDEVIYFNDEYEDGATPAALGARKQRIDFTHTIKTKPKAPRRIGTRANSPAEEGLSLYGEYSNLQLDINLNPLDDDYLVRITDETGKAVYEKAVNAGNIVGLNIDISSYAEGRYQVTVENGVESFTGEFDVQTTEIVDVRSKRIEVADRIYNLQGQRISSLQKGLNIVNGQKVFVK